VAQPPKQINIVVPNGNSNPAPTKPAPVNVDEDGYFRPPKVEPSDTYQAGYQQIDYPHSTGVYVLKCLLSTSIMLWKK
jgi:hypothetical protein